MPDPGALVWVHDPRDARLFDYRALNDPAARAEREARDAIFVAEGRLAVAALLASGYPVRSLLVDDHQVSLAGDLVAAARARGAPVFVAPRDVVAETVGFAFHRGVVAIGGRPPMPTAGDLLAEARAGTTRAVVCVLEGVNDHENLGALFRNAAAFNVRAVLLDPTCADPLYRRSVRVSLGHVLGVPFTRLGPWPAALDEIAAAGFELCALSPHPMTETRAVDLATYARTNETGPLAVLVGAEGPGLSPDALARASAVVSIPMAEGVDSLNVATAAAVAFYELSRPFGDGPPAAATAPAQ